MAVEEKQFKKGRIHGANILQRHLSLEHNKQRSHNQFKLTWNLASCVLTSNEIVSENIFLWLGIFNFAEGKLRTCCEWFSCGVFGLVNHTLKAILTRI